MTKENQLGNARADLIAAADALKIARVALGLGIVRDSLSRAYYAVFHAARAMLLLQGFEPKTHAGLGHLLNEKLIRAGLLESRYNLIFTRLQAYRQASDYAYVFEVAVSDAEEEIRAAEEFVQRAEALAAAVP